MADISFQSVSARRRVARWLIPVAFVSFNAFLLIAAVPGGHFETDSGNFYNAARGLLEFGDFVNPVDPQELIRRPPGYPLLLAAGLLVGGGDATLPIIFLQILALFATGLVTGRIVEDWLPGYGILAVTLVVLNPNAISLAQTLMPATFYALALVGATWALLAFARRPNFGSAFWSGLALGVAIMFRGDPRFLILVLPIGLPLAAFLAGSRTRVAYNVAAGFLASLVAIAVVTPWFVHAGIADRKIGNSLIESSGKTFLAFNLGILEKRLDPSLTPAEAVIVALERGLDDPALRRGADESFKSFIARSDVTRRFFQLFSNYPINVIAKAAAASQVNLFVSGGASNIRRILGISGDISHELYVEEGYGNRLSAWLAWASTSSFESLAFSVVMIGFAAAMRCLGLLGLFVLVARRNWPLLLIVVTVILYSVLLAIFNGLSRYRVPIEPALMILGVFGIDVLRQRWLRNRSGTTRRARRG